MTETTVLTRRPRRPAGHRRAPVEPPAPQATASATKYKVTNRRVLSSEWGKFWSLRSSLITLGVALALLVAIGAIASASYSPNATTSNGPPSGLASEGATTAISLALTGLSFAQLAIGVLGVLMSAGEYSTGMIRSTLAAVPRRLPVLWSKSAVIGATALVLTTVGALAAFQLGTLGLHGQKIALTLGDDGVLRSLAGAGVYLALVAVFGVALGVLLRSTAGGVAALVGILLILPGLASLLPSSLYDTLKPYFPSNAGSAIYSLHREAHLLSPGAGLAVFAGWVALTMAAAAVRLKRSDA